MKISNDIFIPPIVTKSVRLHFEFEVAPNNKKTDKIRVELIKDRE